MLAQTLYQYLGPGLDSWLADLKPVQIKELKESFDALEKDGKGKGTLKPERLTRAQAREVEAAGDQPTEGADGSNEAGMFNFDAPSSTLSWTLCSCRGGRI